MPPTNWESSEAPCPNRGPGLTHIQDTSIRPAGRCAACGVRILFPMEGPTSELLQAQEQMQERLKQIGRSIDEALGPDCIIDHNSLRHGVECGHCNVAHEGRFITDLGPQGTKNAYGRGEFTERQQARLLRHVEFVERYGKEGPPLKD